MRIPLYQIDAFAERPFTGNPAAVCPLESWLPAEIMQAVAAENNLPETAFFVPEGEGWRLRWFTPTTEVDLCGHATLAAAHVIVTVLMPGRQRVVFRTEKAGDLAVTRQGAMLALDFPAWPPAPCALPATLGAALVHQPKAVFAARDYLAVYDDPDEVAALAPDFAALAALDRFAVIATAPGDEGYDFVSRYFAPVKGIPEDPVTGAAHCMLAPYWSKRLGEFRAYQASRRGGEVTCRLSRDRVELEGSCVFYLEGEVDI